MIIAAQRASSLSFSILFWSDVASHSLYCSYFIFDRAKCNDENAVTKERGGFISEYVTITKCSALLMLCKC